jgi:hypothetical protein
MIFVSVTKFFFRVCSLPIKKSLKKGPVETFFGSGEKVMSSLALYFLVFLPKRLRVLVGYTRLLVCLNFEKSVKNAS